jgi:hypothetical protein
MLLVRFCPCDRILKASSNSDVRTLRSEVAVYLWREGPDAFSSCHSVWSKSVKHVQMIWNDSSSGVRRMWLLSHEQENAAQCELYLWQLQPHLTLPHPKRNMHGEWKGHPPCCSVQNSSLPCSTISPILT